jgi:CRP/FNR family transcriptional regulator
LSPVDFQVGRHRTAGRQSKLRIAMSTMHDSRAQGPKIDCAFCGVLGRTEWSGLAAAAMSRFNGAKVCRRFDRGEVIFYEGDSCRGIYCIKNGLVGIRKIDGEGNSVLLGRLGYPGTTLGYRPLLAGECHRGTAEALEDSQVCFIAAGLVRWLLANDPNLGLRFLRHAAKDLGNAEEDFFHHAAHPLRLRLAHLLLVLKEHYGESNGDGTVLIELPVRRQDLASMMGARPESLSRVIKEMDRDGLATFSGRHVRIRSIEDLLWELEPEGEA